MVQVGCEIEDGKEYRKGEKAKIYFNKGVKERLESKNEGVPISLMAIKQNRQFIMEHLMKIE